MVVIVLIHKYKEGGINANTIIKNLKELNYQFLGNDKNGNLVDGKSYIFRKGEIPILLSAPHAVKQYRETSIKASDFLTGPLALYLAEKCNCSCLVRVYNNYDDPNYPIGTTLNSIENEYLIKLRSIIQEYNQELIIDIHGCTNEKISDCSIWSDAFNTCKKEIVKIFENNFIQNNITLDYGSEFLGGQVTRQSALLTNAFQLEIKRKIRSLKLDNYYLLESFLEAMEQSIYECEYSRKLERIKTRN